jgi:hypothetical protein
VRWHKRLGITSAIFVVLLAATGMLLNHTYRLQLGETYVSNPWVLDFYNVEASTSTLPSSMPLGERWVTVASASIFFDTVAVGECKGHFLGAVAFASYWATVCQEYIYLFTNEGQLIEKIERAPELISPVLNVGICDAKLCLKTEREIFQINLDTLHWQQYDLNAVFESAQPITWLTPEYAPEHIRKAIAYNVASRVITWEKVVLDIHSGRFMGSLGPLVLDVFAIIFIIMAATGVYMWFKLSRNSKR